VIPEPRYNPYTEGDHTALPCVIREADFRDAETLLIRLNHLARPNREAALILERVKLYLADQFRSWGPPLRTAR
jgi:hypothetical protein